jgi:pyridoxamine 5'-phosphate oxidase-like protein
VRETPEDLDRLQALIDRSIEHASPFLHRSFQMPEHSLSAAQLAARLEGSLTVALATVTARGEPRVAPIDAFFLRGHFHVPTVAESLRARHAASRPGVSLTYFEGKDLAVIAHGEASIVGSDATEFDELDSVQVACGHQSVREWEGTGVYLRVDARSLFTFTRHAAPAG